MSWFKKEATEKQKQFLPVGVEHFHKWADEIIALTPLPSNDSIKFALASIILELDKSHGRVSQYDMATMLVKAAANQVAAYVFQDIKNKRIAADKAKQGTVSVALANFPAKPSAAAEAYKLEAPDFKSEQVPHEKDLTGV